MLLRSLPLSVGCRRDALAAYPVRMIAITQVVVGSRQRELVSEVLESGQLAQGPMVAAFEDLLAQIAKTRHAVALNSGTSALVATLRALGIGRGDEVITSPLTFAATLNAILAVGATARFADIGPDYTVRLDAVESLVNPKTVAVLPVHLYGLMADVGALSRLTRSSGLALIEDAAQAIGASADGIQAGKLGTGCFSFYATKNVTTGEGGAVTTDDSAIADYIRVLRNQGMKDRYQYEIPGDNLRMTDVHAAIGIPQLEGIEAITAARQANAHRLNQGLSTIEGIEVPWEPEGRRHVYHQYTIRVAAQSPVDRDSLVASLRSAGVGAAVYYPRLVFDYGCYRDDPRVRSDDSVPAAFDAASQVVSLPVHPHLTEDDVEAVIAAVRQSVSGAG